MHVPALALGEPVADQLGLVRAVVVHNDVDVEVGRDVTLDLVKKLTELQGAVAAHAYTDNDPSLDVERGEERSCSVPRVVVRAPLGLAGPHRQKRLGSIERLNLA